MSDVALFEMDFLPSVSAMYSEALICLRDAVPDALRVVVSLSWWKEQDERNPGKSGDWAYLVCRNGIYFERTDTWGGWESRPQNLLPWAELVRLVGDDPRRESVVEWTRSLTAIDRWKDIYRPFELWPQPEGWHPSYLEHDRERAGYEQRMQAWGTVQAILTDAARVSAVVGDVVRIPRDKALWIVETILDRSEFPQGRAMLVEVEPREHDGVAVATHRDLSELTIVRDVAL